MRKVTELTENELETAKEMYMEGVSVLDIANKLDVARTSLSYHVNKKWKPELELMRADLFARFSRSKRTSFIKMSSAAMKVMARALQELADREEPPTVREAKGASDILEALDKITRLDDGNPTDIIAEKPASIIDIEHKLRLDPFYTPSEEIEDAEVKELNQNTN